MGRRNTVSYNLPKHLYPNGFPDNETRVIVPNGGGDFTTDWINPTSGIAEGWEGNLTQYNYSIVTGNGFTGNAQRVEESVQASAVALEINNVLMVGCTYILSIKYRANNVLRIFNGSGTLIGQPPVNTGNAAFYEFNSFVATDDNLRFLIQELAGATEWFEIDEINIIEQPLVAYYPFNGNANDESGNGYDGTVNGATLTEGRYSPPNEYKAYSFNGGTDYISTTVTNLIPVDLCTVAVRIKPTLNTLSYVCGQSIASPTSFPNAFRIRVNTSGQIVIFITNSTGLLRADITTTLTLDADNWYDIVVTCDFSDTLKLYVNGSLVSIDNLSAYSSVAGNSVFYIGNDNLNKGIVNGFDGTIDRFAIWNRVLTIEEQKAWFKL